MDVGTAQLGAIAGAAGAVLVLTAGRRATLAGGFALLAFAEAALVGSLAVADRLASPTFAALGLAGLVAVAAATRLRPRAPLLRRARRAGSARAAAAALRRARRRRCAPALADAPER